MKSYIYIPSSFRAAGKQVRLPLTGNLDRLPKHEFIQAWSSVAYLFPGLHPDGFEDADSGWPRVLKRFAAEAWRRADADELNDDELYPGDAQWSGLYDRMFDHAPDETARRMELAELSNACVIG